MIVDRSARGHARRASYVCAIPLSGVYLRFPGVSFAHLCSAVLISCNLHNLAMIIEQSSIIHPFPTHNVCAYEYFEEEQPSVARAY